MHGRKRVLHHKVSGGAFMAADMPLVNGASAFSSGIPPIIWAATASLFDNIRREYPVDMPVGCCAAARRTTSSDVQ